MQQADTEADDAQTKQSQNVREAQREKEQQSTSLVVCRLGEEYFALPMQQVSEVVRTPRIRQMPLAPNSLKGLASLRGKVVPIIALHELLGLPAPSSEAQRDSRIVVMELGQTLGIWVDHVDEIITLEAGDGYLATDTSAGGVMGHHRDARERVIQWLDIDYLLTTQLSVKATSSVGTQEALSTGALPQDIAPTSDTTVDDVSLVSFEVAGQSFAFRLAHVQQILRLPNDISAIPNAPTYLLGLITLRGMTLPLVALGPYFGLARRFPDDAAVIVLRVNQQAVGLVVDDVHRVVRIKPTLLTSFPALASGGVDESIEALCLPAEGQPLITLLSERPLLALAKEYAVLDSDEAFQAETASVAANSVDSDLKLLELTLAGQQYGLPIEVVEEVSHLPGEVYRVPATPTFIDGMMNRRGAVLPIIDVAKRLGVEAEANGHVDGVYTDSAKRRIVVIRHAGVATGLVVDAVNDVIQVEHTWIDAAPILRFGEEVLVEQLVRLPDRAEVVQLLNISALFNAEELAVLAHNAADTDSQDTDSQDADSQDTEVLAQEAPAEKADEDEPLPANDDTTHPWGSN